MLPPKTSNRNLAPSFIKHGQTDRSISPTTSWRRQSFLNNAPVSLSATRRPAFPQVCPVSTYSREVHLSNGSDDLRSAGEARGQPPQHRHRLDEALVGLALFHVLPVGGGQLCQTTAKFVIMSTQDERRYLTDGTHFNRAVQI